MKPMRTLTRPPQDPARGLLDGTPYGEMHALFEPDEVTPRIDRRFVERRESVARAAFRSRSRQQLVVGGIVVVLIAVAVVAKSGLFAVRAVDVTGATHANVDQIVRVANIEGSPSMFALDQSAIARRVSTIPWVSSANVVRHFPNRVEIRIVEFKPAAVVVAGNESALVASNGRVLMRVAAPPTSLVEIIGMRALPRDGEIIASHDSVRVAAGSNAPQFGRDRCGIGDRDCREVERRRHPVGEARQSGSQVARCGCSVGRGCSVQEICRRQRPACSGRGLLRSDICPVESMSWASLVDILTAMR